MPRAPQATDEESREEAPAVHASSCHEQGSLSFGGSGRWPAAQQRPQTQGRAVLSGSAQGLGA